MPVHPHPCLIPRLLIGAIATAAVLSLAPPLAAQPRRVLLPTTNGEEPNAPYSVGAMSADGRYLLVTSDASNLVPGDTVRCGIRSCSDVFVLDRDADGDGVFDEAGATVIELVSRRTDGAHADNDSYQPSISDDGRFVAFTSYAANLLPPGAPLSTQVYVHDRQTHQTGIVSVSSLGEPAAVGTDLHGNVISGNGRVVAFRSAASNLVAGDTNGDCGLSLPCYDVFLHDRVTGQTTRVSVSSGGAQTNHQAYFPALTPDGRFVAFSSDASTLVVGDANFAQDVFVHDRATGTTAIVSVTSDGHQGDAPSFGQSRPAISPDGRLVFFASQAGNLPAGAVHDRATGRTVAACVDPTGAVVKCQSPTLSADGRWLSFQAVDGGLGGTHAVVRDLRLAYSVDLGTGYGPTISANGRWVSFNNFTTTSQAFLVDLDADADGLPDPWEARVGLSTASANDDDGPTGDADDDGRTNAQEYAEATPPLGLHARYFAEGATIPPFGTRFAIFNPSTSDAHAQFTFMKGDGTAVPHVLLVPPRRRLTLVPAQIPDLASAEFSVRIDTDLPLVVDRTMAWDAQGYGAHAETSLAAPAARWYLAEGATHSGFDLFYLLQNPGPAETTVRVRYLRPAGVPLEKIYWLPPSSRTNVWVDVEEFPGLGAALSDTDVSAVIETLDDGRIIVERAMYLTSQGRPFNAGHESAGVTSPRLRWFLAEGATGDYFDLFVLIANPGDEPASLRVTYLLADGQTYARTLVAPANSRSNIWVDLERFDGVAGTPLADVAVSTVVEALNDVPVVVERAQWWPGPSSTWHEAHNAPAASETGTRWAIAEGSVDPLREEETYILVANTSATAGEARVAIFMEDGTSVERSYVLLPSSRTSVPVGRDFGLTSGRRFSAIVDSVGTTPAQIVVERAMYWNAAGQRWAAGTSALGARLQ